MEKKKVIVYVAGGNFYYGLKKEPKWRKYYWLNIVALFEKFMKPNQELVAVKYFPHDQTILRLAQTRRKSELLLFKMQNFGIHASDV